MRALPTLSTPTSIRPGDSTIPILYNVDRTRDGRTFTTRRVTAIQHGHAIFHLEASFQRAESGPEHQDEMPDVPDPETLPTWQERMEPLAAQPELVEKLSTEAPDRLKDWLASDRPIDIRHVTKFDPIAPENFRLGSRFGCGPTAACRTRLSYTNASPPSHRT